MDAMINKLNKGGHRVYLLTGQKGKKALINGCWKDTIFYDDDNVIHIMESVNLISYCLWELTIPILTGLREGRNP